MKFTFWVVMMVLAMSLPPAGQAALLLCIAAFTCWLLRVSPLRYLKWLLIPFSFLAVGLVAIIISFARTPDTLLWGIQIGQYWVGLDPAGLTTANQTFWRSMAALAATFWFMLNMPFEQLIKLMKRGRLPLVLIEQILLTGALSLSFWKKPPPFTTHNPCASATATCAPATAHWRCWSPCCFSA